ncbi:MAG: GHKL domain-containing protein, partial [Zoogloea sp.]|nr:GHKL domain-containing protein [Zoogloea sp.]
AAMKAAYVVVLQCTEGDRWRLLLVFAANGVVTAMNAQRARQLAQARGSGSARLVAGVYGLLTGIIVIRMGGLATGLGGLGAFDSSADQLAVFVFGTLSIILGNFGYVGMVLERVANNRLQAERDSARAEERRLQSERRNLELDALLEERDAMLQRLAHSSRATALGMFASAIAHELNQPLGAIRINAEGARRSLDEGLASRLDMRTLLDDIAADTQRAVDIVARMRDLLVYGEVDVALLDLREVVLDILSVVEPQAARGGIRVDFETDEESAPVRGNRTQLQQVVLNLMANAFDAVQEMPDGQRRVQVSIRRVENTFRLTVSDSGQGIAEARLPRIFEPFQTTKRGGMGVGLAISHSIVRNQGGAMRAGNASEGGALFEVTLPAVA